MALRLITPPAEMPVTAADVENHLRADLLADTSLIDIYIAAVTGKAESYLKRSIITQTLELALDSFPVGKLHLPAGQVQSIVNVKYTDIDGNEQTVDPATYRITDSDNVLLSYYKSWPEYRADAESIKIRYTAGYGLRADVPAQVKAWILMNVATLYENRESVIVGSGGVVDLNTVANGLLDPLVNW